MKKLFGFIAFICAATMLMASCSKDEETVSNLTAYFTTDKSVYYEGDTVYFTNGSTGGSAPYTYNWDFKNGETSTEANPEMIFETTGAYEIELTVTDSKGNTAQSKKSISVDEAPLPEVGELSLKWVSADPFGEIRSSAPAIADDNSVYMVSNSHELVKVSATDGSTVWSFDLRTTSDGDAPAGNTHTTPSVDTDGTIYVGTGDTSGSIGRVYAVNPDGTKKWVIAGDATTGFWNKGDAAKPRINYLTCAIDDTHVYMGNGGSTGSVLAVDKATGLRAGYVANADNDGGPAGGVTCGMVLTQSGTVVWAGGKNGFFGASATNLKAQSGGNITWDWQIYSSGDDQPTTNANGSAAVGSDGTIYTIASLSGDIVYLFANDADGIEKWRCEIPNTGAQDQGGVVITSTGDLVVTNKRTTGESNGGISVVSSTGTFKWSYGVAEDVSCVAAVDQDDNIHFSTQSGNYYIVKEVDGAGELVVKKSLLDMIVASGVSYASDWAVTTDDGDAGGKVWSSPVIAADGVIYVGVTNNVDSSKSALVALSDPGITGPADSAWPMKGQNQRHSSIQK